MLTVPGWITLCTIVGVFVVLQLRRSVPIDLLFFCGLVFVTLCGIIPPEDAFAGFACNAVLTIAGLLVCAAGLRSTGVLDWLGQTLFGSVKSEKSALWRLALTLVTSSAFLLNTALVAMSMPFVIDWCRKRNINASRLLLPVSYLTILGGVCTLVGTSTTLVVDQQLTAERIERKAELETLNATSGSTKQIADHERLVADLRPMGLWEIGKVGLPCALLGTAVLLVTGPFLLPNRSEMSEQVDARRREYLVEMLVQPECSLIGRSVEQAGLRHLPGLFLIEIDRHREVITPVKPREVIRNGDRLIFTGIVCTIVDLEKIPGLVPVADLSYSVEPAVRQQRNLVEVVLSRTCPMIGTTVRKSGFRQHYGAAIVAVHRNGVRLTNKIGDILLEPGDTLLLQTASQFANTHRDNRDFYLVSNVAGDSPRRHDRAAVAGGLALLLIGWLCATSFVPASSPLTGISSTAIAALTIAGLMVATRCLTVPAARSAINLPLLVTIGSALGLARALDQSGAGQVLAQGIIGVIGNHPYALLIAIYLLAVLFTEMISNTAVAATMLPLAVCVAQAGGYSPRPFVMAITLAASLSFLTPIGYQTNLMVMGPGGYQPRDYFRVGLPIALTVAITALTLIPLIWPF